MRNRRLSLFVRQALQQRLLSSPTDAAAASASSSTATGRKYATVSVNSSRPMPSRQRIRRRRCPLIISHESNFSGRTISIIPTNSESRQEETSSSSTTTATQQQRKAIDNEQEPPLTTDQQNLLYYTQALLGDMNEIPIGCLSHSDIIEISNCIEQWISSGEHPRYSGAQQVHSLLHRLILERSAWKMYHLDGVIRYFNIVYNGGDFVDKIMTIVTSFEEAYEEVQYKSIISLLCSCASAHAATAAELILHRFETRLQDANSNGHSQQQQQQHSNAPTVETYNSILTSWAKSGRRKHVVTTTSFPFTTIIPYNHHPNAISNLVSQMLQLYNANPSEMERMRPDFLSFNTAISSLTREQHFCRNNINDSDRMDNRTDNTTYHRTIGKVCFDHLQTMLLYYRQGHYACAPDLVTFSTVLMTLGRGKDTDDASRAMHILDEMLHLCGVNVEEEDCDNDGRFVLNMALFDQPTTFSELYGDGDHDQIIINQGLNQYYQYNVLPRNKHFNVVLALMAESRTVTSNTLKRARRYLNIMEQLGQYENQRLSDNAPDDKQSEDGHQQDHFWEEEDISTISKTNSKPDTITYNTLLKIAAKAGEPMVADEILQEMMTKYAEGNNQVKPDSVSFNTVLLAWSKMTLANAEDRVTELLRSMQDMADNGDLDSRPDHVSLTTVINTLAQSAKRNKNAPIQAEAIIKRMENNRETVLRPDVVTYTSLIKCWMESGSLRAASQAGKIIEKLHARYEDGYVECKPDTMAYNVALNAIAKCKVKDSAERAEALLQQMQDRFAAGDRDVAPTASSFATVMSAWARSNSPNGGIQAEKLLRKMHEMHRSGAARVAPNTVAYSTCIFAWSKSGQRNAGERAMNLLKEMERCRDGGMYDMKPNAIIYTNAMEAWIASKQPDSLEQVEAILEQMVEQSKAGDVESAPTTTTFNVVLKAIRHSSHPKKHLKAEQVLDRMKKLYANGDDRVRPSIITYNTFIGACAKTKGDIKTRRHAFSLVLSAFGEIQEKQLRTDAYTWPAIWQACQCHLDVNTDLPKINSLFDLTAKSGVFNELLFNSIRGFLPPSYLQKKLNRTEDVKSLSVHDLPEQWTRNVKLGRAPKQKIKR